MLCKQEYEIKFVNFLQAAVHLGLLLIMLFLASFNPVFPVPIPAFF